MMDLEVCANSFTSALAAEKGGAIRIELCENMAEGGTTPSYGQIRFAKEHLTIAVWPIIRPRGGDFLYSVYEFELMKMDITLCKALKCDGAVTGILTSNGEIDKERCAALIELADPMPLAFHRAFDMTNDLSKSLETLIELGFKRVLTSGGAASAYAGISIIADLVQQAQNRIEIMPGGGITPNNVNEIRQKTGAKVFHASARTKVESKMTFKNQVVTLSNNMNGYLIEQTNTDLVKELLNQ